MEVHTSKTKKVKLELTAFVPFCNICYSALLILFKVATCSELVQICYCFTFYTFNTDSQKRFLLPNNGDSQFLQSRHANTIFYFEHVYIRPDVKSSMKSYSFSHCVRDLIFLIPTLADVETFFLFYRHDTSAIETCVCRMEVEPDNSDCNYQPNPAITSIYCTMQLHVI